MKVQCLEFREGTVNVNVIVIVNLRSVAIIPLMPSALRGDGDTSADNIVILPPPPKKKVSVIVNVIELAKRVYFCTRETNISVSVCIVFLAKKVTCIFCLLNFYN